MGALVSFVIAGSVAGSVLCLGLAAVAWHYRQVPTAVPFGGLALAIAVVSLGNAVYVTSDAVTAAYVTDRVIRSVSIHIPPLWLVFILAYVGRDDLISARSVAVLWAYPVAFIGLSLTAPIHGITSTPDEFVILTTGGVTAPYAPPDILHLPTLAYSFGLTAVGLVILIGFFIRSRSVYRKQTLLILGGSFVAIIVASTQQLFALTTHPGIDLMFLAFVVIGITLGWALIRYEFLELTPLAEDILIDELPDPVFVLDSDEIIIDHNPAAATAFGHDEPQRRSLDAVAPGLAAHLDGGRAFRHVADGEVKYYKPTITPLQDQYGTARGRLVVLRDITGQQRRQDRLEALQEATRRFLSASTDDQIAEIAVDYAERTLDCQAAGVFLADEDGTLRPAAMTENATDLFDDDELEVGPDDGFAAYQAYEADEWVSLELDEDVGGPLERLSFLPLGDLGILATGSADSDGFDAGDEGFATILTRTTQVALNRVERESELRRSRKALERRTEQITFFNGVLRHSLRNALLVIEGRAEHLRGSLSEEELEHVDTIVRWCSDLASLNEEISSVNDTVTASETERLEEVDLSTLLNDRLEAYEERYPDATFEVDIEDGLRIRADELARSVLDSIVDNAVVHNDSENPHVEIWTVEAADRVQVHVGDDGPGITDEMKAIVFERAVSTDQTASGFGLHFVSVLMNLYGGNLRFEDNDPAGTIAVLEFQEVLGDDARSDDVPAGVGDVPGDVVSDGTVDVPGGSGLVRGEDLDEEPATNDGAGDQSASEASVDGTGDITDGDDPPPEA